MSAYKSPFPTGEKINNFFSLLARKMITIKPSVGQPVKYHTQFSQSPETLKGHKLQTVGISRRAIKPYLI